ncbi:MAG: polynucleotide kinase-phosphatase [Spirochaetaceae bacterium]|jgi:protein phosphatase|nr:polynucleotide kinase-phosphatase [Spirochaetaceae bacterium]
MRIVIPNLCLTALVGASGSGKSTFAKTHFKPTEILSSDFFRGLVSDDETDQQATQAAFDCLYYVAEKRLSAGKLTVIDATNVQSHAREKLLALAKSQNIFAVAIVFDMDETLCIERNKLRGDRNFGAQVVRGHIRELRRSFRHLKKEGFRYVYALKSPEEASQAEIVRTKLWNDKTDDSGPFDIIGDVHGCYDELRALLEKLNYRVDPDACTAVPPENRKTVFLGDLCDRGPKNIQVLKLAMNMSEAGYALCVPGNHDVKLSRYLWGKDVKPTHGMDVTIAQIETEPLEFKKKVRLFLDGMVSHYLLDNGRLAVTHAGQKEKLLGRSSGAVRAFCLYGETTGETDEFGLPVRLNWAEKYTGKTLIVYGHMPSQYVREINNTVCIDTGCVFGGKLTCFRYPEKEFAQTDAARIYYTPVKPLNSAEKTEKEILSITDILGSRHIATGLHRDIAVSEESAALALEHISRFSVDPRWLMYLPPTMSPCGTSRLETYLEYPDEAFDYFKKNTIERVICEEKHMGSRSVIVLCRDAEAAKNRFRISDSSGVIYTRTGRRFFDGSNAVYETALLDRLRMALNRSGFWERFATDWVCLDAELMPWSAKAQQLVTEHYASVGVSGRNGLNAAILALKSADRAFKKPEETESIAVQSQVNVNARASAPSETNTNSPANINSLANTNSLASLPGLIADFERRKECLDLYAEAYRRYCWTVQSADDFRVAPFHILATEGKVWMDEQHPAHLSAIAEYIAGGVYIQTNHLEVNLSDPASVSNAVDWWKSLTESGGEGMVVKPLDFAVKNGNTLVQPAVKCRGREYLRIIYGPEYTEPARLERLRKRSLHKKRSLALAEFALGVEALERFVSREPLSRVHECVFGILALENESVDPRL